MWVLTNRKVIILSAAGVLVVLIVIGFLVFGNNEGSNKGKIPNTSDKASSEPRPEGFTFFDIGSDSTYTFEMREKLDDRNLEGVMIYSGTVPILTEKTLYGRYFEVELFNPKNRRRLTCAYRVKVLDYLKG